MNNVPSARKMSAFCRVCLTLPLLVILQATVSAEELDDLRAVQQKVQQVVQRNTDVTVAIGDGEGWGSGVVVNSEGLIITAGHVLLTGGRPVRVKFPDGREVPAKILGKNLNVDAGMLQITAPGPWPYAELGSSRELKRGDWCICLGHSGGYQLGRRPPVRAGRILGFEPDVIISDAVLIGGDSGGPLFDLDGRVIGIHSNIGTSIADNRHVAIDSFKTYWSRMKGGESWGTLPGLEIKEKARAALGIRVDRQSERALISEVHANGAAERAGIRPGDIVQTFDGVPVRDSNELIELVKQRNPGDEVQVQVLRDENEIQIAIVLDELKLR